MFLRTWLKRKGIINETNKEKIVGTLGKKSSEMTENNEIIKII